MTPPDRHHAALVSSLVSAGFDAANIAARTQEGPFGTRIAIAHAANAYPTTGTRTLILDGEEEVTFADLVRRRGWLTRPPDDARSLVQLASYAFFAGQLMIDEEQPVTVGTGDGGALELRFTQLSFPRLFRDAVSIVVGEAGPARVTVESAEPQPEPAPTPIDAVVGLQRAIDASDANAILDAIARVKPTGPREIEVLARAATQLDNRIASGALDALGASDAAVQALREELPRADPERRAEVLRIAGEYHGPEFVAKLT